MNELISCLTATHGRYSMLREAISCFVQQDYPNKEMIILNNHPIHLHCDIPGVVIFNETGHKTLGSQRNRLAELSNGQFIRCFDDDDLYMPWSLSQSMDLIGPLDAAKPARSWMWNKGGLLFKGGTPKLDSNVFESSWVFRRDFVLKHGYGDKAGDEHNQLFEALHKSGTWVQPDLGEESSYIYRWGHGAWHISGSTGNHETAEQRTLTWQRHNQDTGNGVLITPVDLNEYWKMMVGVAPKLLELFDRSGVKVRV